MTRRYSAAYGPVTGTQMTDPSANPAHRALSELDDVETLLATMVQDDQAAVLDPELLHRSERAISMGTAMLMPDRDSAAVALEAAVAGAAPRAEPAHARDLLMVIGRLAKTLRDRLEQA